MINNQSTAARRITKFANGRWFGEDYPGAEPRFQIKLLSKDVVIFVLIPTMAIILFKSCENAVSSPRRSQASQKRSDKLSENNLSNEIQKSQIIEFNGQSRNSSTFSNILKRSPGTLVRVRLLNAVETYSSVPVHAQIIDAGLGRNLIGATIIGDATSDANFNRIGITFKFVRELQNQSIAVPISARALSLDGTFGIDAVKKEGFFARSALNSSGSLTQDAGGASDGNSNSKDLTRMLLKALAGGTLQEFSADSQVEKNRAQVLTLSPNTEFFVELTDTFPSNK
jgi:hypothetical protein